MLSIIYFILATAMFFSQDTYFTLGGVEFSLKNPCAVAILSLALLNFIVTVRPGRSIVLVRHTIIQMIPYLIPFFFSAIIWVLSGSNTVTIANGIGMIVPQLLSVALAAATLYLFGSKGVFYCLGSMCAANFLTVLLVIADGGLDVFLSEFFLLLSTFSAETGPLILRLELHDLTFAFGPFLIYLLFDWKKIPHAFLWFLPSLLLFLVGLKRIAIPAVALGFCVALILRLLPDKAARQTALCLAIGMTAASFLYIVGIRNGLFLYLEEHLGINTMGRVNMFANLAPYYDISITYMGMGTGYERFVDWASGVTYQLPQRTAMPIHNDFLRMYLNIGFVGYWVWIWSYLTVRLRYWFRQGGKDAGCLFLCICIYCFVLYATDNAIYYPYTMLACTLIPMSYRLDTLSDAAFDEHRARWRPKGNHHRRREMICCEKQKG